MIDKQEVLEFARLMNLLPQTVEKDYVLGWVLAGIENHSAIFPVWCFKGGTCLKNATLKPIASQKIWTLPFPCLSS